LSSERHEIEGTVAGRIDAESAFLCYHGGAMARMGVARHIVVEWIPFERVMFRERLPMPGAAVHEIQAFELAEIDSGTRLRRMCGNMEGPSYKRALLRPLIGMLRKQMLGGMENFREAVEAAVPAPH